MVESGKEVITSFDFIALNTVSHNLAKLIAIIEQFLYGIYQPGEKFQQSVLADFVCVGSEYYR
jgi:hypothetical protein